MKTARKIGKVTGINSSTSSMRPASSWSSAVRKIIRIDTKSIRASGRSTQSVKLLDLELQDDIAAAVIIPSVLLRAGVTTLTKVYPARKRGHRDDGT